MILCQHTDKEEEEVRISKRDIYSLDGKGNRNFVSSLFQVYRLIKDDAAFFVDKIAKVVNLTPISLHFV